MCLAYTAIRVLSVCSLIHSSPWTYQVDTIVLILQMRKLKFREVE